MSELDPSIRIPEHHLLIDLTDATGPARARVIRSARVAGGVILNPDPESLIDSAPLDPTIAMRHRLETELHMRLPFSFLIYGKKYPCSHLRQLDPEYKRALVAKVAPKGFKPSGVTWSLNTLQYLHDDLMSRRFGPRRNTYGIEAHSGEDYSALIFNNPSEITAEGLRNICNGLGETAPKPNKPMDKTRFRPNKSDNEPAISINDPRVIK